MGLLFVVISCPLVVFSVHAGASAFSEAGHCVDQGPGSAPRLVVFLVSFSSALDAAHDV